MKYVRDWSSRAGLLPCAALLIACALLLARSLHAQVINFDVPGSAGAGNYRGQGAYPDAGHNFWNAIAGGGTTAQTNLLSDGVTPSTITLTSELGGTFGTQGTQGTAAGLLQPYQYNDAVLQQDTLNKVPAGTYSLYLYGINNTGTRGTIFTVSTSLTPPVSQRTVNTPASLTNFVAGANYVVFTNLVVGADGAITFTWVGNPDVTLSGNNEGDLNALQLVRISSSTNAPAAGPNFGPNVLVFNPSMSAASIQNFLNGVFAIQQNNQFGPDRYAFFFMPGDYSNLDVDVGYYTGVFGLGQSPDDVTITGDVHSDGVLDNDNATVNFWRSCENMAVVPTNNGTMTWAVSQGTSLRRVHVLGSLNLANTVSGAWSSGGFLADSKVDGTVSSITQQQWISRNDIWGAWSGQNWNMVFVGVSNPPSGAWPGSKYTVINQTPYIAEKPYLYVDASNNFNVRVPALAVNGTSGTTWASGATPGASIPISQFYIAQPNLDNAASINAALSSGRNIILAPGVYNLTNSILVTRPDAIILGLGYPTLVPTRAIPAIEISGVTGVKVSGIIFDAGPVASPSLLEVGTTVTTLDYSADPTCLYDICSRVGGEFPGTTINCVTINANNVLGDNLWLWRADHGNGVGWTQNASTSGLVVNGANVTIYGLFVEHHEGYQTLWNGNGGRVYFYQSELPYDPPSQSAWSHNGVNGYASYKVADNVASHEAYGLGVYAVFLSSTDQCFNAIETPAASQQVNIHDMITVYIAGESGSEITHIINGTGATVSTPVNTATADYLWANPQFSVNAGLAGPNFVLSFPSESAHSYQVQYKNTPGSASWLNLGGATSGNDATLSITNSVTPNHFFRVVSH